MSTKHDLMLPKVLFAGYAFVVILSALAAVTALLIL